MELSDRLQAVANLVTPGLSVADVGCDHGYIPIYLVQNHISPYVIAMDVNEGPLERAKANIRHQQENLPITLKLSDGLKALRPSETECVVIAGMGGGLVMKILSDSTEVVDSLKECILQPQSEISKVRAFLLEKGFLIIDEDMVCDDGKYYPMMKVIPPGRGMENTDECSSVWSETELRFGKRLLEKKNQVLFRFLKLELERKSHVLDQLLQRDSANVRERISEIQEDIAYIESAIACFDRDR